MRLVRALVIFALLLGLFRALDWHLASRADALVLPVLADYRRHPEGLQTSVWTHQVDGVEADVCNTLTGRIWLGLLLPRSAAYTLPEPLAVTVTHGFCRRHSKSSLVFSAASPDRV